MTVAGQRWGVVGGGMLGLGVADLLARRQATVTVFEGADHIGGLADPWRVGDIEWDRHYHVISPADRTLLGMLDEIGVGSRVTWKPTRTGAYAGGRLHSVSDTVELLRYPHLGLVDKARLGMTVLAASRIGDAGRLEDVPIRDWLVTWSGEHAYENFWKPLLRSKLGDGFESASAAFIWAVVRRLYEARRAGLKREVFGFVPGGYRTILDALDRHLAARGVEVRTSTPIQSITPGPRGPVVRDRWGDEQEFDGVVVTLVPRLAERLLPTLDPAEAGRLRQIEYLGVVCASLVMRRPLTGCYVTNLLDPAPFTGIIEMSSLVGSEHLGGATLVYLPRYVPSDDPLFQEGDDVIEGRFVEALEGMFPDFRRSDVEAFRVSRAPYVIPRPVLGYSRLLPPIRCSVPGVMVASTANIVNGTSNVNEVLDLARRVVGEIDASPVPHEVVG